MDKLFDSIGDFLKAHPAAIVALIALIGLALLLASIFDWNWLYGDVNPNTYSVRKIDGLINLFGRKTARVIFGTISFMMLLVGVLIMWLVVQH